MKSSRKNVAVFLFILSATIVYSNRRECHTGTDGTHPRIECKLQTDSISTFLLGDWGGDTDHPYTTEAQLVCADFISRMGPKVKPDFFTGTGDNFYWGGINRTYGARDPRFSQTFENVFRYGRGDHGEEKIPWYIILGNHDYYGDVKAQIDYSKINSRWVLPDYSYSVKYTTPKITAEFIYIDTQILCGETWNHTADGAHARTGLRGRPIHVPTGPPNPKLAKTTLKWINRRLRDARADYLFVVGHYPMFTTGNRDSTFLQKTLLPMMHKYKATGYICGHEHNLQYMTTEEGSHTLHHFLTGGAHGLGDIFEAKSLDPKNNPWNWKSRHYFPQAPTNTFTVHLQYGAMMHMKLTPAAGAQVNFYNCSHFDSLYTVSLGKR